MLKYFRLFSLLMLLAALSSCGGGQPKSERVAPLPDNPEGPLASQPDDRTVAPSLPQTPSPVTTPSQANPASPTQPSEKQAVSPQPEADPEKLPELSVKEKTLVSKVTQEVEKQSPVSTQNTGVTTVNRVLIAQQAMWLLSGSFSTDFKVLEPNLPIETDEYRFTITQGDEVQAVIQAIAKNEKLHSFTGATVAVPTQIPQSALCRTKLPSKTPPQPPKIEGDRATCANDGVLVDT